MSRGIVKRLKPPCFIELQDVKDIARLVCALERTPIPVFNLNWQESGMLAAQLDLFLGTPVFYYVKSSERKHFLGYRNSAGVEDVLLTDSPSNPAFTYSPIVKVKSLPKIFERGLEGKRKKFDKFLSVQTEDLASLAKLGSYKMIFEEPPLPLFLFPHKELWTLGAFARIDEYEEASIFFYNQLDSQPSGNFLRFSPMKIQDTAFTNRIEEHGYVFIKIIRLAQKHPLVNI